MVRAPEPNQNISAARHNIKQNIVPERNIMLQLDERQCNKGNDTQNICNQELTCCTGVRKRLCFGLTGSVTISSKITSRPSSSCQATAVPSSSWHVCALMHVVWCDVGFRNADMMHIKRTNVKYLRFGATLAADEMHAGATGCEARRPCWW